MSDPTKIRAGAEAIAAALTAAWNAADAAAFANQFATDADFVNIFATHVAGRSEIEQLHKTVFDTIYKGSRNTFTVEEIRALGEHAAVAHIRAHLHVPSGPLTGEISTLATAVLVQDRHGWLIDAFQNTRVQTPPTIGSFQ
ncbi:MAG TPA: SgcJ/EcaC family oxidoreductase [Xanthomonadales bacterium]|nr:SgcJ/EcaC family oxidoreductase [Xanthomonadales bacterium]